MNAEIRCCSHTHAENANTVHTSDNTSSGTQSPSLGTNVATLSGLTVASASTAVNPLAAASSRHVSGIAGSRLTSRPLQIENNAATAAAATPVKNDGSDTPSDPVITATPAATTSASTHSPTCTRLPRTTSGSSNATHNAAVAAPASPVLTFPNRPARKNRYQ